MRQPGDEVTVTVTWPNGREMEYTGTLITERGGEAYVEVDGIGPVVGVLEDDGEDDER